jgi:hypothetical protein
MLVVAGSVVVLLGAASVAAVPVGAKGNKVLFKSSLKKPTKALPASSGDGNNTLSTEYTSGRFVIHSKDPRGAWLVSPALTATASQLAKVRIDVDVNLANVPTGSSAGVFCRRTANPNGGQANKYVFLIAGNGTYSVFKDSNGSSNQIQGGSTTVSGNKAHLRVDCKGPVQPGASDTVSMDFGVGSNSIAVTDSQSALPSGRIGLYANGLGDPGFSNLTVTQL